MLSLSIGFSLTNMRKTVRLLTILSLFGRFLTISSFLLENEFKKIEYSFQGH